MSAVSTHRIEWREARFQDYQAIAALETSQGLASRPAEEWRRQWAGNPCYEEIGPRWPIGWVLEEGERIVGCLTNIPRSYSFRGRALQAAVGRGWILEEPYHNCAALLMNEYLRQENVDLFLMTSAHEQAAEDFRQFGLRRVPVGDWGMAPFVVTEYGAFAESELRGKGIPLAGVLRYPAGWILSLKDRFTRKAIPKTDIDVALGYDFDQRFDNYWEILSQRSDTLLARRTREVLRWQFPSSSSKDNLWVLTSARNGNIEAYAVLQRRDEPQTGLKRMRLLDFQACDWTEQYCAAILERAYAECRAQGIAVLEQWGGGVEKTRIFDQCAPHRRNLPGGAFFYLTQHPELAEQLTHPESWAPSSFDADAGL